LDPEKTGINNRQLMEEMEKENIESRHLWNPMHLQPIFSSYPAYVNGTSERLFQQGLCLPSGSNMTDEDRERVLSVLKRAFNI
ncbi:MAG: pyridoxal phosphate-dependent aminotransferase, partial [Bacteroidetes bacterium]